MSPCSSRFSSASSFAIITDFKTLLIPNWISLALLAAFAPFAVLHVPLGAIGGHFLVMAIVLALSVFFLSPAGWAAAMSS